MAKLRQVKVAFCFPGQAIKVWPDIGSLRDDSGLAGIVDGCHAAFEEAVGKELAAEVLQANSGTLMGDTLLGQLRAFHSSTVMWIAFLNYAANQHEPSVGTLMADGLLKMQLTGDSAGFNTAAHAPEPGNLDDQFAAFQKGARNTGERAGLMTGTPHDYSVGGMAATTKLPGWVVNRLVGSVNRQLGHDNLVQLVKHNAPSLKVVAGPREGLEIMAQHVANKKGGFLDRVSPYWFHHSLAMELAGKRYGLYLAGEGVFTTPSRLLTHVSYVTGRIVPPHKLTQDLAQGVWQPVYFYTFRGPSVHGAMHKSSFYDLIVLNAEVRNWLRDSPRVATHLMNDLPSLAATKEWLMQALSGEVQPGKQKVSEGAKPSQQLSPGTPYQARS